MIDASRYAALFRSEALDHVETLNRLLLQWEGEPGDLSPLEPAFRAVHTLKGMFSAMGIDGAGQRAHELENSLAALRGAPADDVAAALPGLFAGADVLEQALSVEIPSATAALPAGALQVRLRVPREEPLPGVRAFLALRKARELGTVSNLHPPEDALGDDGFSGELDFLLEAEADPAEVEAALDAVGGIDVLTCRPAEDAAAPSVAPAEEPGEAGRFVRVAPERLDGLLDRVGELLILRDRLQQLTAGEARGELAGAIHQASRMLSDLHQAVMQVRMVPVWQITNRFPRLVRDAAQRSGKEVDFQVEGRDVELDRSLLGKLSESLVHLLRNAVDHGIEAPGERERLGKPRRGRLRLRVLRDGAQVEVHVSDDGRGIDRDAVASKAAERGVAGNGQSAALSDSELLELITTTGVSTARSVTEVSGRGVGLDVVARQLRALGGSLEVGSTVGTGTTFKLRLPLTLALLQALLVQAGGQRFAIPLLQVGGTLEAAAHEIVGLNGRDYLRVRGELVPLLGLATLLGISESGSCSPLPIVLLASGERPVALAVDQFLGRQEIVSKEFRPAAGTLNLFAGATILGDGRASLILNSSAAAARLLEIHASGVAAAAHPGPASSTIVAAS